MKPFPEVVEALGGQGVVVVLPRELSLDIAAGVEGLGSLDDEQVLGVDIGVLGEVEVLLRDEDALAEEVLDRETKNVSDAWISHFFPLCLASTTAADFLELRAPSSALSSPLSQVENTS